MPIPKRLAAVITELSIPVVEKISNIFAVCEAIGRRANVVVPTALLATDSIA